MKKCVCVLLLAVLTLLTAPTNFAYAATEANILQVDITEQTMTVFTDISLHSGDLSCTISNQRADITATGLLSDEKALSKTTILVDVSTSMPAAMRNEVITAIEKMIERKSANEEFRIITFGDELITLQDFSADRYDLAAAIKEIKFEGNQSKIYDAVYNTISRSSSSNEKATFYRTIAVTDGVDNTASGITKEELFLKLQNERYPVDVIAVGDKEIAEDKELSAIVRMSGGRYYSLHPGTDTDALAQSLEIRSYFYIEATVPASLLDGTIRQVDMNDGVHSVSIDAKFPVFGGSDTPIESEPEVPEAVSFAPPAASEPTALPEPEKPAAPVPIAVIAGGSAALLIVIAVIIAVMMRKKKKAAALQPDSAIAAGHVGESYAEKTEFVGDVNSSEVQYTIKLSKQNDPSQTWTLMVSGDLIIGRAEHCHVRLDDKSVSREQCKITAQGTGLVIVHLGSTNKTLLNGSSVTESCPLQSGDMLKFGREVLRVNYIQTLGSPPPKPEQPRNPHSGKTESIF